MCEMCEMRETHFVLYVPRLNNLFDMKTFLIRQTSPRSREDRIRARFSCKQSSVLDPLSLNLPRVRLQPQTATPILEY